MLLDDNPRIELTDQDATNLVRVLCASAKKAVGEKIVPSNDARKATLSKSQKVDIISFQLLQKLIFDNIPCKATFGLSLFCIHLKLLFYF